MCPLFLILYEDRIVQIIQQGMNKKLRKYSIYYCKSKSLLSAKQPVKHNWWSKSWHRHEGLNYTSKYCNSDTSVRIFLTKILYSYRFTLLRSLRDKSCFTPQDLSPRIHFSQNMEYLKVLSIWEEEEGDRWVLSRLTVKCVIEKALTDCSEFLLTEDEKIVEGAGIWIAEYISTLRKSSQTQWGLWEMWLTLKTILFCVMIFL